MLKGEYVNYLNVLRSMHTKLPFSIGQIGKAFRNEITPGNFIYSEQLNLNKWNIKQFAGLEWITIFMNIIKTMVKSFLKV